jgi:hypothetical protein
MTTHYNLEIISTSTHFKVTYRDKKFRAVTHLRGAMDDAMLKHLGKVIPRTEDQLPNFIDSWKGKVIYNKEVKNPSLYSLFLHEWTTFYENFAQLQPKFTGADGNALKSIMQHLKLIGHSDNEALEVWKVILSNWHSLDDFHKNNTDLKYINSKFNILINAIKKQNNTVTKTNTSGTNGSVRL